MRKIEVTIYKFNELCKTAQTRAIEEFNKYLSKEDNILEFEFNYLGYLFSEGEWL